jgi:hypothetical protein
MIQIANIKLLAYRLSVHHTMNAYLDLESVVLQWIATFNFALFFLALS